MRRQLVRALRAGRASPAAVVGVEASRGRPRRGRGCAATASVSVARDARLGSGRRPGARASAGRAKSRNVTIAQTGLPGRPNTSVSSRVPNHVGLPGRSATRQKRSSTPSALERRLDVVVRADRHAAGERSSTSAASSARADARRAWPRGRRATWRARERPRAPACVGERGERRAVGVVDLAGAERLAGRRRARRRWRGPPRAGGGARAVRAAGDDRDAELGGAERACRRRRTVVPARMSSPARADVLARRDVGAR